MSGRRYNLRARSVPVSEPQAILPSSARRPPTAILPQPPPRMLDETSDEESDRRIKFFKKELAAARRAMAANDRKVKSMLARLQRMEKERIHEARVFMEQLIKTVEDELVAKRIMFMGIATAAQKRQSVMAIKRVVVKKMDEAPEGVPAGKKKEMVALVMNVVAAKVRSFEREAKGKTGERRRH